MQDLDLENLVSTSTATLEVTRAEKLLTDLDDGIQPLFKRVDRTLDDYAELVKTVSDRVNGLADSIEQARTEISALSPVVGASQSVDGLVGEGSATRYDLELLLKEGTGAARLLRLLIKTQ